MSYKTYITEALVCGSIAHNTSDKNYLLFSKEAGMLWCSARSVREEKSKQRCALQDFSYIRVSLIKGKSGWRVGSTEALGNAFLQVDTRAQRGLINFVVTQLRRYVHGEVQLQQVYEDVSELCIDSQNLSQNQAVAQRIFLVRLLSELGYIAPEHVWIPIVHAHSIKEAMSLYGEHMLLPIEKAITEASQASHL